MLSDKEGADFVEFALRLEDYPSESLLYLLTDLCECASDDLQVVVLLSGKSLEVLGALGCELDELLLALLLHFRSALRCIEEGCLVSGMLLSRSRSTLCVRLSLLFSFMDLRDPFGMLSRTFYLLEPDRHIVNYIF